MLKLNSKQISFLRAAGHALNPVVMIGNKGLSEEVLKELDVSLKAHELIKSRYSAINAKPAHKSYSKSANS